MPDILLLTAPSLVIPQSNDPYLQGVLDDDHRLMELLQARGYEVARKAWSDSSLNWKEIPLAVFRSIWDYHQQSEAFKKWLYSARQHTRFINSADLIQWNMDKHYLRDLQQAGIPVIPSLFIKKNSGITLNALLVENYWEEAVLKPVISASSADTYRINLSDHTRHEATFQALLKKKDMMLQPFQSSILTEGELSLIFLDETYSHAVRKKGRTDEFRVQREFGGQVTTHQVSPKELHFGASVVAACPHPSQYARVDIIRDNNGQLALAELELIEPEMWFHRQPDTYARFAEIIDQQFRSL